MTVREVPLQSIADAAGPHTRLIACSHVAWTTGELAPPVPEGIPVLLDGAQGVGAVPLPAPRRPHRTRRTAMSLLAQLKKDSLLARKAADGVRATLLSTHPWLAL